SLSQNAQFKFMGTGAVEFGALISGFGSVTIWPARELLLRVPLPLQDVAERVFPRPRGDLATLAHLVEGAPDRRLRRPCLPLDRVAERARRHVARERLDQQPFDLGGRLVA